MAMSAGLAAWSIECLNGAIPCTLTPEVNDPMLLRIGRQVQGQPFWEKLIQDERLRNTISREHCQIRATRSVAGDLKFTLKNLSQIGTVINGVSVHHDTSIAANDVIGLGSNHPPGAGPPPVGSQVTPVVLFRLCAVSGNSIAGLQAVPEEGPAAMPSSKAHGSSVECCLECIPTAGRNPADISGLAEADRVLAPAINSHSLKVGRSIQPVQFWDAFIPDSGLRTRVSREHFEVKLNSSSGEALLVNLSGAGTFVNGTRVRAQVALRPGDVIALPMSTGERPEEDGPPVATFRYSAPLSDIANVPLASPAAAATCKDSWIDFQLSCTAVAGRHLGEVLSLSETGRILHPTSGILRVGRSHQLAFWEVLVPEASARNKVSRDHFEVRAAAAGTGVELINRATSGTLVNGTRVHDKMILKPGAIIAVPSTPSGEAGGAEIEPVVSFEYQGPEPVSQDDEDWSTRMTIDGSASAADHTPVMPGASPAWPPSAVSVQQGSTRADEQIASQVYGSGFAASYPYPPSAVSAQAAPSARDEPPSVGSLPPAGYDHLGYAPSGYAPSVGSLPPAGYAPSVGSLPTAGYAPFQDTLSQRATPPAGQSGFNGGQPPFELQCVSALGLSAADLGFLPKEMLVWHPNPGEMSLRVGRTVQPEELWRSILREERLRNTVGREQFEITRETASDGGGHVYYLTNLGSMPTQVNDQHVHDRVRLQPMDVIGIGASLHDKSIPAIRFRFAMESSNMLASASVVPGR